MQYFLHLFGILASISPTVFNIVTPLPLHRLRLLSHLRLLTNEAHTSNMQKYGWVKRRMRTVDKDPWVHEADTYNFSDTEIEVWS